MLRWMPPLFQNVLTCLKKHLRCITRSLGGEKWGTSVPYVELRAPKIHIKFKLVLEQQNTPSTKHRHGVLSLMPITWLHTFKWYQMPQVFFAKILVYLVGGFTHPKNISQIGNLPQMGVNIPKIFETTTQFFMFDQHDSSSADRVAPHPRWMEYCEGWPAAKSSTNHPQPWVQWTGFSCTKYNGAK